MFSFVSRWLIQSMIYFMSYSEEQKYRIWYQSTRSINGYDHSLYALDNSGNEIHYQEYGNTDSDFGWEIDHIIPQVAGGQNVLSNLQAIHWRVNRAKGDKLFGNPWFRT